jgi:3'(2'), 5'-bisphosphate nucleotidase
MNDKFYLLTALAAAIEAGRAMLEVYRSPDFKVEEKADKSPLTLADKCSHEIIVKRLGKLDVPILSEEGKDIPYKQRKRWETYWLIDPLDGTKEFIKKNGEFTVNIAIIRDRNPAAGVICVPDKNVLYWALKNQGSFKIDSGDSVNQLETDLIELLNNQAVGPGNEKIAEVFDGIIAASAKLPVIDLPARPFTIIGSRSHASPELEAFVEEKRQEHGEVEFISAGSSLKLCLVAEGKADIYPRTGPTMEWDTAAGQAIAENAGCKVLQYDTIEPLIYNKENLLNPWFVVLRRNG